MKLITLLKFWMKSNLFLRHRSRTRRDPSSHKHHSPSCRYPLSFCRYHSLFHSGHSSFNSHNPHRWSSSSSHRHRRTSTSPLHSSSSSVCSDSSWTLQHHSPSSDHGVCYTNSHRCSSSCPRYHSPECSSNCVIMLKSHCGPLMSVITPLVRRKKVEPDSFSLYTTMYSENEPLNQADKNRSCMGIFKLFCFYKRVLYCIRGGWKCG